MTELGAEIIPIGCSPNGKNINDSCGTTHPDLMTVTVKAVGADLGIAFDGDGDRVLMVDHAGNLVDGDQLLYLLAKAWHASGQLSGPVVGTLMTNLGLERALAKIGIDFRRANVGDRYVMAMLNETGGKLGGETSGHLLCLDKTTTGDGLVSALQVLVIMIETGQSLAELSGDMPRFPQVLINVRTETRIDLDASAEIQGAIRNVEQKIAGRGRVLVRASGTEPVVRVMVEGEDEGEVSQLAEELAGEISRVMA
jgi:phosphoglucosamine mutase